MILEEIEENPNCRPADMMRFREIGPAKRVVQVRLYHEDPNGRWYRVIGWTDQENAPTAEVFIQPVEDSGSGVAYLLYSAGNCGLRFKSNPESPWSLTDPTQWGEPFLLLGDLRDVVVGPS
jgi:hypothetical protein